MDHVLSHYPLSETLAQIDFDKQLVDLLMQLPERTLVCLHFTTYTFMGTGFYEQESPEICEVFNENPRVREPIKNLIETIRKDTEGNKWFEGIWESYHSGLTKIRSWFWELRLAYDNLGGFQLAGEVISSDIAKFTVWFKKGMYSLLITGETSTASGFDIDPGARLAGELIISETGLCFVPRQQLPSRAVLHSKIESVKQDLSLVSSEESKQALQELLTELESEI